MCKDLDLANEVIAYKMYEMTSDDIIAIREKNRCDLSRNLYTYVTVQNMDTISPERIFIAFMNAIDGIIFLDGDDIADRCEYHLEWTAKTCWERMHPEYREQILAAVPDIEDYMEWRTAPVITTPFDEFYLNTFRRLVHFESAEIVKRAQTKMLKEEIAMKVMHPDRIEKLASTYGMDPDDYLDILD